MGEGGRRSLTDEVSVGASIARPKILYAHSPPLLDIIGGSCYNIPKLFKEPKMKLVLIIGSGAVGKMTVGQELMKITNLRLFHNHMMIEPVIEIFNSFNGKVISRLREVVLDEFVASDNEGMIFTYMWAFDMPSDLEYIMHVASKFDDVYCVELIADQSVRLERNKTENRLRNKASKRDTAASDKRVLNEDANHRLISLPGEIPFENYLRIDNTNIEPNVVAKMIKEKFSL